MTVEDCRKRLGLVSSALTLSRPVAAEDEPWNVADVVALEQQIAREGTSLLTLMNRAGAALAEVVAQVAKAAAENPLAPKLEAAAGRSAAEPSAGAAGEEPSAPVVILAGNGNNGGDGWVAARLLQEQGIPVVLVAGKAAADLSADPARTAALEACRAIEPVVAPTPEELKALLQRASVVVDALLGTGFAPGEVREPFATWIALVGETCGTKPVVAADVPSAGAVSADVTVTFLRVKKAPMAGVCLLADLQR